MYFFLFFEKKIAPSHLCHGQYKIKNPIKRFVKPNVRKARIRNVRTTVADKRKFKIVTLNSTNFCTKNVYYIAIYSVVYIISIHCSH